MQAPLFVKPATSRTQTTIAEPLARPTTEQAETTADDSTVTLADFSQSTSTPTMKTPNVTEIDTTIKKIVVTIRKSQKFLDKLKQQQAQNTNDDEVEETEDEKNKAPFKPKYYKRYITQETQTRCRMVHFPDFGTPQATARIIVKEEFDDGTYNGALTSIAPGIETTTTTATPVLQTNIVTNTQSAARATQMTSTLTTTSAELRDKQLTRRKSRVPAKTVTTNVTKTPIMTTSIVKTSTVPSTTVTNVTTKRDEFGTGTSTDMTSNVSTTPVSVTTSSDTIDDNVAVTTETPITAAKQTVTVRMPERSEAGSFAGR